MATSDYLGATAQAVTGAALLGQIPGRLRHLNPFEPSRTRILLKVSVVYLVTIDAEGETLVLRHEKAPGAVAVCRCAAPGWDGAQSILALHILEQGDNAAELVDVGGLHARGVIIRDQAAQAIMIYVSDLDAACDLLVKRRFGAERLDCGSGSPRRQGVPRDDGCTRDAVLAQIPEKTEHGETQRVK